MYREVVGQIKEGPATLAPKVAFLNGFTIFEQAFSGQGVSFSFYVVSMSCQVPWPGVCLLPLAYI